MRKKVPMDEVMPILNFKQGKKSNDRKSMHKNIPKRGAVICKDKEVLEGLRQMAEDALIFMRNKVKEPHQGKKPDRKQSVYKNIPKRRKKKSGMLIVNQTRSAGPEETKSDVDGSTLCQLPVGRGKAT